MFDSNAIENATLHSSRICLYGQPKVGKSTFVNSIEGAAVLDCERGYTWLKTTGQLKVPVQQCGSWPEVEAAVEWFIKGGHGYKMLVFDSITRMMKMAHAHYNAREGLEYSGDGKMGKGWLVPRDWVAAAVRRVSEAGYGYMIVGHVEKDVIESSDGNSIVNVKTSLPAKLQNEMLGDTDCNWYLLADQNGNRFINTLGFENQVGGTRFQKYLPPKIPLYSEKQSREIGFEDINSLLMANMSKSDD